MALTRLSQDSKVAAAALAVGLTIAGCSDPAPPPREVIRPVKAIKVADAAEFRQRAFPGKARATQEVDLSFRVGGPLIALPVDIGTEVKEGDTVARIDPRDFQVNVRNVRGQLDDARAAQKRANADLERLENVFKQDPGATSQAAIDKAREARDRARANVTSLQASLTAANDQLEYTYLKAPFAGTVVAKYVENFEDVRARQPILRVVDDSRVEMVIGIPENLIALAAEVTKVEVEFDAFPGLAIPAEIKEIGTEASETTRTFPVTVIMNQPDGQRILPGMAGKVTGEPPEGMRQELGGVEVPISATFADGDQTYVWVIDEAGGVVSRRAVSPGMLTNHGLRLTSGVEPGEWVVTAGVNYLSEGQQVRILRTQGN